MLIGPKGDERAEIEKRRVSIFISECIIYQGLVRSKCLPESLLRIKEKRNSKYKS